MKTNLNLQGPQQNFGMAIYADHKAIKKLTNVVGGNIDKNLLKLNELITSQKNKNMDIFLSTDKLNNLTAKVGFSPEIIETPNFSAMRVIEEAVSLVNSIEARLANKSDRQIVETLENKGTDAAINQVLNKLKIDV